MDFEIQSVSDLFSILFKMEGQTDLEIATSKDLANLSEDSDRPALSLSSTDQTWFELSSDCSDEEKEQYEALLANRRCLGKTKMKKKLENYLKDFKNSIQFKN